MSKISTYFGVKTTCDRLYEPKNLEELIHVRKEILNDGLRYFVIGAGSNSLVSSNHFPGAIISTARLTRLEAMGTKIIAGAGVENTSLSQCALDSSLGGLGWMNRLPGLVGATVRMNARCYGGEISQVVSKVITVDPEGAVKEHTSMKDIFFGYKNTAFMTNDEIVAEVVFSLKEGDQKSIKEKMDFCESDRKSKFQFDAPSCGCVFKNNYDVGVPSGMLLESAGAKKLGDQNAHVSPGHANFIFNHQNDSTPVLELSKKMRLVVWEKFGVWMEYEMELLGEFSNGDIREYSEERSGGERSTDLENLRKAFRKKML